MRSTRELIRRVRRLEIRTRRLVNQSLAGSYHSVFRGRGMEFAEVREYVPGDDVRTIDWNVSARLGHPFVKKFTEERELTVVLAVDVSGSERFGTSNATKLGLSAEIAALLAFSAIRNNDRVGLLTFTDRIELYLPPRKGREHGLRVLRELVAGEPRGKGTAIAGALEFLRRVVTKRAVVFLLSDFQDDRYEATLRVVARKHDVVAIAVDDPRERELPPVGFVAVEDPETGESGLLDAGSPAVRSAWAGLADRARDDLRRIVRRTRVDLLELSTGEPYERPLLRFFRDRARRAAIAGALSLLAWFSPAAAVPEITLDLAPLTATVGDPIELRLTVEVGSAESIVTPPIGPEVGAFKVLDGAWQGPLALGQRRRWIWSGHVAVYRPGDHEWPALTLSAEGTSPTEAWRTPSRVVTIRSVLDAATEPQSDELADIKAPVALPPDWRPFWRACGALGLLLLAAGTIWWLHRRLASRLAAAEIPDSPFRRMPAHLWAFEELDRLEARGWIERGETDLYYSELARIVKLYFSGRFRVDLMERTTAEVPELLRQAGSARDAIEGLVALLRSADRVKFAGDRPASSAARQGLDEARRLVETTRPVETPDAAVEVRGAA